MSDTRQKPGIQLDDIEPTGDAKGGSMKKKAHKVDSKKQNPKMNAKMQKSKMQKDPGGKSSHQGKKKPW